MQPDLKLIVGKDEDDPTEIKVYHQVMSNASPVFRNMLEPHRYEEGTKFAKEGYLELPLPDDDPSAMTIVCDILHLRSDRVPTTSVDVEILYKIASLVDKYDLSKALQPWAQIWFHQPLIKHHITNPDGLGIQGLIHIVYLCYHFDYYLHFERAMRALTLSATDDAVSQPTLSKDFESLPLLIQEEIVTRRPKHIETFRRICLDVLEDLEERNLCKLYSETNQSIDESQQRFNCSSIMLGNIIIALREEFGSDWRREEPWYGKSLTQVHDGVKKVASRMQGPSKLTTEGFSHRYHYGTPTNHRGCSRSNVMLESLALGYKAATAHLDLETFKS